VRLLRFVLLVAAVVLGLTPAARPVAAGILEAHCPVAMAAAATAEHRDHALADAGDSRDTAGAPSAHHVPADCCLGGLAVLAPFDGGLPPRDRPAPPRGLTEVDQLVGLSHPPASPPPETTV